MLEQSDQGLPSYPMVTPVRRPPVEAPRTAVGASIPLGHPPALACNHRCTRVLAPPRPSSGADRRGGGSPWVGGGTGGYRAHLKCTEKISDRTFRGVAKS
jgi:hypothetical protein